MFCYSSWLFFKFILGVNFIIDKGTVFYFFIKIRFPASSDIRTGAVGSTALSRWLRPLCFQNFGSAQNLIPEKIKDSTKSLKYRDENDELKFF
jgi:hypothetical protein